MIAAINHESFFPGSHMHVFSSQTMTLSPHKTYTFECKVAPSIFLNESALLGVNTLKEPNLGYG